ncbi:esterase B1-like [Toxorhynchites rutilus septentrionalis]|uniref:esterase B1-like n=1 Tax=Toxorhynchites rutilus septentrionalis TaxID=329112 RepID=UPI00247AF0FE|nr:esterase B1-like [Toxorhynchites rutilus septentrionalis]
MNILNPVIVTNYGPIKGIRKKAATGVDYHSFQRIPYAKPPIGMLRFRDAQPPNPWTEPLDCTVQGAECYQISKLLKDVIGSEDCLHINVYTKNLGNDNLAPVMLYIHGGAFMRGSSGTDVYGPDYLIQRNVVLVTFNYRVGAFGFISFDCPELELPGNAGLKDQNLAIRWVVDNIDKFGGDPKNITLFGESAGGCSVQYHMISKLSEGLFQRAIIMSGSVLSHWSIVPRHKFSERLAKALGWDGHGGERGALDVLITAKAEDIAMKQATIFTDEEIANRILFPFGPVIEPYAKANCLIPVDPLQMCRGAWGNNINILIGGTSDEGLFFMDEIKENPSMMSNLRDFEHLVPLELDPVRSLPSCKERGIRLKKFYYGDVEPSYENRNGYLTLMSDKLIWHGLHRTIYSRINSGKSGHTYVYHFSVDSETYNHYRIYFCDKNVRGTAHADDLSYVFKNSFSDAPAQDTFEHRAMMNMVDLFTTFASNNGNPNGGVTDEWEPVANYVGSYKCLGISNGGLELIDLPERQRMELWDSLYAIGQLY